MMPLSIPVGSSPVDVTVQFSPTAVGSQAGALDIISDDPDEALVSVALIGTGINQ